MAQSIRIAVHISVTAVAGVGGVALLSASGSSYNGFVAVAGGCNLIRNVAVAAGGAGIDGVAVSGAGGRGHDRHMAVAGGRNLFLSNQDFTASIAVSARGQAGGGAGGGNSCIYNCDMSQCCHFIGSIGVTAGGTSIGGIAAHGAGGSGYDCFIAVAGGFCLAVSIAVAAVGAGMGSIASLGTAGFCHDSIIVMTGSGNRLRIGVGAVILAGEGLDTLSLTARISGNHTIIIIMAQLAAFVSNGAGFRAAVAGCSFGAILGAGGITIRLIVGEAVIQCGVGFCVSPGVGFFTAVTLGSLGTGGNAVGIIVADIVGEAVIQCTACVSYCVSNIAAVALSGLGAILGAGSVAVADIVGEAVIQCAVFFRAGIGGITAVALGSLGAISSTGGIVIADIVAKAVAQLAVHVRNGILSAAAVITQGSLGSIGSAGSVAVTDVVGVFMRQCGMIGILNGIRFAAICVVADCGLGARLTTGSIFIINIVGEAVAQGRTLVGNGIRCAAAVVTIRSLGTVDTADGIVVGNIVGEAVLQGRMLFIIDCVGNIAAVTLGGLGARHFTSCVVIVDVGGKAVAQGAALIGSGVLFVTAFPCTGGGFGAVIFTGSVTVAGILCKIVAQNGLGGFDGVGSITAIVTKRGLCAIGNTGSILIVDILGEAMRNLAAGISYSALTAAAVIAGCGLGAVSGTGSIIVGSVCGVLVVGQAAGLGVGNIAAVTLGGHGAGILAGGVTVADVVGEAVALSGAFLGHSILDIAAVTLGGLGAVQQTGGVVVADIVGEAVIQGSRFIVGVCIATNSTGVGSITTGCTSSLDNHILVAVRRKFSSFVIQCLGLFSCPSLSEECSVNSMSLYCTGCSKILIGCCYGFCCTFGAARVLTGCGGGTGRVILAPFILGTAQIVTQCGCDDHTTAFVCTNFGFLTGCGSAGNMIGTYTGSPRCIFIGIGIGRRCYIATITIHQFGRGNGNLGVSCTLNQLISNGFRSFFNYCLSVTGAVDFRTSCGGIQVTSAGIQGTIYQDFSRLLIGKSCAPGASSSGSIIKGYDYLVDGTTVVTPFSGVINVNIAV